MRNATLFENPKNVEAVVKTIVCALNVTSDKVNVRAIKHYVDTVLIQMIRVNASSNTTMDCIADVGRSSAARRLQSGLDTYVVEYQVRDPPPAVISMEPATVAMMLETSSTLVASLDIPPNSYVAITADPPSYLTTAPSVDVHASTASSSNAESILMGVFIPLGIVAIASVIAATVKKRSHSPVLGSSGNSVVVEYLPTVIGAQTEFSQTNPRALVKKPSRHSMMPLQIRRNA